MSFETQMQRIVDNQSAARFTDREGDHYEADDILCAALRHEGYDRLVDLFNQVKKWYA